jgi:U32 family peptidase
MLNEKSKSSEGVSNGPGPKEPTSEGSPRPELLSPAGGPEAGYAALAYGADAVYLGLRRFSARAEAANFDLDELDAFVAYAHSLARSRRVFLALNTLILEAELPEVVSLLAEVSELGINAVIVQDLGVARLLRRHFPRLELHASTQMAVHNLRGVEALARLGVRRAVAARELTLDELRNLCRQPEVEIECFIHGAVCYSYSGLCLFSSHALGRSANRGRCAYVCGGSFTAVRGGAGRSALPFAMKDLALPDRLSDLAEAGVASFKIEGRKKSPLYVAAVTDFYRRMLDGTLRGGERREREADLQTVFSRPWTELYLGGARQKACGDPDRLGHRGAAVGRVEAVRGNRRKGTFLRFTTKRRLEVHDGLQIEVPGQVRPYGFAVEELRVVGASGRSFEVEAESEVEIGVPADHPVIPIGAAIHCTSSQAVKRAFRWTQPRDGAYRTRRPIAVRVRLAPERLEAEVAAGALHAAASLEGSFGPAREPEAGAAAARAAFERLGGTGFVLASIEVENRHGLFAAPSQWNGLRRAAVEALERAQREGRQAKVEAVLAELRPREPAGAWGETASAESDGVVAAGKPAGGRRWSVKAEDLGVLDLFEEEDWEGAELVLVVGAGEGVPGRLETFGESLGRDRIRLALPPVLRPWDEARLLPLVARFLDAGWRRWEIANLAGWGQLGLTPGEGTRGLDVTADWPLYVTNSAAAAALLELGLAGVMLSPEDGGENLGELLASLGPLATVVVYQHTPLFVSETCPRANLSGVCPGRTRCTFQRLDVVSDFGNRVRILNRNCRAITVAEEPFCLAGSLEELARAGAESFRVDLQYGELAPEEARRVWRLLRSGQRFPGGHPGNYGRGRS